MCDIIEHGRGAPKNILVEFERDPSMRATAVFIIARSPNGQEEGIRLVISDKGKFVKTGQAHSLIDGVDIV